MFPECRLLHQELNAHNRIAVMEKCGIIITKVFRIHQTRITACAPFPTVNIYHICHGIEPFERCVGQSEVTKGCHLRDPEKHVDSSSGEVVPHPAVGYWRCLLARKKVSVDWFHR